MNCKISVIMPALNEEANIQRAVQNVAEALSKMGIIGEIVVINDGSSDGTSDIVRELTEIYPFLRMLEHSEPMGIGASFMDGVRSARGEIVTMLPGDGENDAFEILRYLPLMEHVDVVVPFIHNTDVRSRGRRILSALYRTIINLSFRMLLNYTNGTVIYRRCLLQDIDLKANGFFYQTELLIKCIKRGYFYAEVPCRLERRTQGGSKALNLSALGDVVRGYISTMAEVYFMGAGKGLIVSGSNTSNGKGYERG